MASTYTSIYIHIIFVVKFRKSQIDPSWEEELNKYITGVITNRGSKLFAIGGMPDHLHIFIDLHPSSSLSDLIRDVKSCSTKWINKKNHNSSRFQWQPGFAAFSYAKSQLDIVVKYIHRQKDHHRAKSFKHEYHQFLDRFEVEYEEKYLFAEPE
ncbi:MAG: IS200/IS605 family transposase [Bacteroidetes bacterium]|nr:IS200/IS605 family transposase [Bacteroidota bacterium]